VRDVSYDGPKKNTTTTATSDFQSYRFVVRDILIGVAVLFCAIGIMVGVGIGVKKCRAEFSKEENHHDGFFLEQKRLKKDIMVGKINKVHIDQRH
jgi:hypothetical protein